MATLTTPRTVQHTRTSSGLLVLIPQRPDQPHCLLKPGRWTVGSATTCSYRLAGDGVQLRHAALVCGSGSVTLKAWDERTWHNGTPVKGEVRLNAGDVVQLGHVMLNVRAAGAEDVLAQLPDTPTSRSETSPRPDGLKAKPLTPRENSRRAVRGNDLELTLVEDLRQQILDMRSDLAAAFPRSSRKVESPASSVLPVEWQRELSDLRRRLSHLEQSTSDAQQQAEQTLSLWKADQAHWAQREADWAARQADSAAGHDRLTKQWQSELLHHQRAAEELAAQVATLNGTLSETQAKTNELQFEIEWLRAAEKDRQAERDRIDALWNIERTQIQAELAEKRELVAKFQADSEQSKAAQEALAVAEAAARQQHQLELDALRETTNQLSRRLAASEQAWQAAASDWQIERERLAHDLSNADKSAKRLAEELESVLAVHRADSDHWLAELNQLQAELAATREEAVRHQQAASQRDASAAQQESADRNAEHAAAQAEWLVERQQLEATVQQLKANHAALQKQLDDAAFLRVQLTGELELAKRDLADWKATSERQRQELAAQQAREADEQAAARLELEAQRHELATSWNELNAARAAMTVPESPRVESVTALANESQADADVEAQSTTSETASDWQPEANVVATQTDAVAFESAERQQEAESVDWNSSPSELRSESQAVDAAVEVAQIAASSGWDEPATAVDEIAPTDVVHNVTTFRDPVSVEADSDESDWSASNAAAADVVADSEQANFEPTSSVTTMSDSDWSSQPASASPNPTAERETEVETTATSSGRPEWAAQILSNSDLGDVWSAAPKAAPQPVDASQPDSRDSAESALESDLPSKLESETRPVANPIFKSAADAPVDDLRAKLAQMFNLPGLKDAQSEEPPVSPTADADAWDSVATAGTNDRPPQEAEFAQHNSAPAEESVACEHTESVETTAADVLTAEATETQDVQPETPESEATATVPATPVSFADEEEDIDDSVSRYMQRLLGRASTSLNDEKGSHEKTDKSASGHKAPEATATSSSKIVIDDDDDDGEVSTTPVHQVDRAALRSTTAQLRQVANLQALHNVKRHDRKLIYSAFKTKISLASFAFLIGIGFVGLGYYREPNFIVLGGCAICVGILTWFDLFNSIRESRRRSAGLQRRAEEKETDAAPAVEA